MIVEHLLNDWNISVIGTLNLNIIWVLGLEIWDFKFVFRKANLFLSESVRVYFDITLQPPAPCLTPAVRVPSLELIQRCFKQ
jgi:hypothetical protein